jgi:hypothetical protein
MTFQDLFVQLSQMTEEERKSSDLIIFEPNDQDYFKINLTLKRISEKKDDTWLILDENQPFLDLKFTEDYKCADCGERVEPTEINSNEQYRIFLCELCYEQWSGNYG